MMTKILTDQELGEIIWKATHDANLIECADAYAHFLDDLGELICAHFGGSLGNVARPDNNLSWTVGIHVNACVPADGGVFKEYDTDITWIDGHEQDQPNAMPSPG